MMRCRPTYLIILILTALAYAGLQASSSSGASATEQPYNAIVIDDFNNRRTIKPWEFSKTPILEGSVAGQIQLKKTGFADSLNLSTQPPSKGQTAFVQARKSLRAQGKPFDASGFEGVYLRVRGNNNAGAVLLQTANTHPPDSYFLASFKAQDSWKLIFLPFEDFQPKGLKKPLDHNNLNYISLVAISDEKDADIYIDEIGLYQGTIMYRKLTPEEAKIIVHKGTERPFTGEYYNHFEPGVYTCRRCNTPLFYSWDKFRSECGWPSFDDAIEGKVLELPDADGRRTEILCATCKGHLGHVFRGEKMTTKDTRYCVNSLSMEFTPQTQLGRAIFASGCFWGTQYFLQRADGVLATRAGYIGGKVDNPTYKQVCSGTTGHAEAVEVIYDPDKTDYETLAKIFFETHDPTQLNRQGPDIGHQYRSAIFYLDDKQKETAEKLVRILEDKKLNVKTEITQANQFWPAEEYHQDYYNNTGKQPYCHGYTKRF